MYYDANKVKTYTPIIPVGKGPTSLNPEDALYDILLDLNEQNCLEEPFSDSKLNSIVSSLIELLGIKDWIDGEYTIFNDYKIVIETMSKSQFDEMPEFSGY